MRPFHLLSCAMSFWGDRCRCGRPARKWLSAVLSAAVMTLSLLQGLSFCFCDAVLAVCDDGHCHESHAHDCHGNADQRDGESLCHECPHLELDAADALPSSAEIALKTAVVNSVFFAQAMAAHDYGAAIAVQMLHCAKRTIGATPPQLKYISISIKFLC